MGNFLLSEGHCWLSLLGRRSDMTLRDGGVVYCRARLVIRVQNSKEGSGLAVRQWCYPGERI
jgi:hypothetical protein